MRHATNAFAVAPQHTNQIELNHLFKVNNCKGIVIVYGPLINGYGTIETLLAAGVSSPQLVVVQPPRLRLEAAGKRTASGNQTSGCSNRHYLTRELPGKPERVHVNHSEMQRERDGSHSFKLYNQ